MNWDNDTINKEACEWIARLHEAEDTARVRAELHEWMQRSPAHKAELQLMAKRWDELNVLTQLAVPAQNSSKTFAHWLYWPKSLPIAVALIIAVTLGVYYNLGVSNQVLP